MAPLAAVTSALSGAGWQCRHIAQGDSRDDLMSALARELGFPEHFGGNLDALWDCLTDLTEPTALVWTSWHELAIRHPKDWADIMDILTDRTKEQPAFALVLG